MRITENKRIADTITDKNRVYAEFLGVREKAEFLFTLYFFGDESLSVADVINSNVCAYIFIDNLAVESREMTRSVYAVRNAVAYGNRLELQCWHENQDDDAVSDAMKISEMKWTCAISQDREDGCLFIDLNELMNENDCGK